MAARYLLLPTETEPLYTKRYTLDGRDWLFKFDYNARAEYWMLSIGSVDGVWAARGIVIVTGYDLLQMYRGREDMPAYLLIAVAKGTDDTPARLNDFGEGKRVELYYIDPDPENPS